MIKIALLLASGALAAGSLAVQAAHEPENDNNKKQTQTRSSAILSDESLGRIVPAESLIGRPVQDRQGQHIGEFHDLVVDLESGRVIYGVVDAGNRNVALPPNLFALPAARGAQGDRRADDNDNNRNEQARAKQARGEREGVAAQRRPLTLNATKQEITSAPEFKSGQQGNFADPSFAEQVYKHFRVQPWWDSSEGKGKFGNAHLASKLTATKVMNTAGANLGKVDQVLMDLRRARVVYIGIDPAKGVLGGERLLAVPPMALTKASGGDALTLNADKEKLSSAPRYNKDQFRNTWDMAFATKVYEFYGKQPYFGSDEDIPTPTGPEEKDFDE